MDNIAKIKVVGVGGGGGNAVESMIKAGIKDVDFIVINTDQQALTRISAKKMPIGTELTKGLGAGADPEIGRQAAEESREQLKEILADTDMLFIAAGMGGGTGTGAAPVVASIAKELGILTIAVVTKPFLFEGARRMKNAEMGINKLKDDVDALIIVQNEKLNKDKNFSILDAFKKADSVLLQGIAGITNIIVQRGLINLDLADVRRVMKNCGMAHMGIGEGTGKNRIIDGIRKAVYSPLLETTIQGARAIIIYLTCSADTKMDDIRTGVELVKQVIDTEAEIIFGFGIDPEMKESVKVILIATGFTGEKIVTPKPVQAQTYFGDSVPQQAQPANFWEKPQQPKETILTQLERENNVDFDDEPLSRDKKSKDDLGSGVLHVDDDESIPPFLRKIRKG